MMVINGVADAIYVTVQPSREAPLTKVVCRASG